MGALAVIASVACDQRVDVLANGPPTREGAYQNQLDLDVAAIVAGMTRARGPQGVASLPTWRQDLLSQPDLRSTPPRLRRARPSWSGLPASTITLSANEEDERAQLRAMSLKLAENMTENQVANAIGAPKEMEVGTCSVERPGGRTGPWMCKTYTYGTPGFATGGWMWLYFQRGPRRDWRLLFWSVL